MLYFIRPATILAAPYVYALPPEAARLEGHIVKKRTLIIGATYLIALIVSSIGFFRPSWPVAFTCAAYFIVAAPFLLSVCCTGVWRAAAFRRYLLCWAAGALLSTFFFLPFTILAMLSTSIVHLPLLVLTCYLATRKDRLRHFTIPLYALAFILGAVLPWCIHYIRMLIHLSGR